MSEEKQVDVQIAITIDGKATAWNPDNARIREILINMPPDKLKERVELLISVGDMVVDYATFQASDETVRKYFGNIEQSLQCKINEIGNIGQLISKQLPDTVKEKVEAELKLQVAKLEEWKAQLPELIKAQLGEPITRLTDNVNSVKVVSEKIGEFVNKYQVPINRGNIGEQLVYDTLVNEFKEINFEDISGEGHYTDIKATCNDMEKILVEVKNYTNPVPAKEVNKFWKDMATHEAPVGCFISLGQRIQADIGEFKIAQNEEKIGVFMNVGQFSKDEVYPNAIKLAFFIARQFARYLTRTRQERASEGGLRQVINTITTEIERLKTTLDGLLGIKKGIEKTVKELNKIGTDIETLYNETSTKVERILRAKVDGEHGKGT
nr:restriction endonuclease [Candidatus Sigynarchaeum springense]